MGPVLAWEAIVLTIWGVIGIHSLSLLVFSLKERKGLGKKKGVFLLERRKKKGFLSQHVSKVSFLHLKLIGGRGFDSVRCTF